MTLDQTMLAIVLAALGLFGLIYVAVGLARDRKRDTYAQYQHDLRMTISNGEEP